jgi:hypothetical protein
MRSGLILALVCSSGLANAADGAYCQAYADRATNDLFTRLSMESTRSYVHDRLWSTCLDSDTEPSLPTSVIETWDIIRTDPVEPAARIGTDAAGRPPAKHSTAAAAAPIKMGSGQPQQALCSNAHMRTVYVSALSWKCVR